MMNEVVLGQVFFQIVCIYIIYYADTLIPGKRLRLADRNKITAELLEINIISSAFSPTYIENDFQINNELQSHYHNYNKILVKRLKNDKVFN